VGNSGFAREGHRDGVFENTVAAVLREDNGYFNRCVPTFKVSFVGRPILEKEPPAFFPLFSLKPFPG
jgi:hypothetical protein